MKIDILTLFPEMFSPLEHSIVGKAREKGLLDIQYHNFRENAEKARHVDDEPYGGGQGMLLRAQPIFDAFDAIEKKNPRVILLDPAGKQFNPQHKPDQTAFRALFSSIQLESSLIRLMLRIWLKRKNLSLSVVTTKGMMSGSRPW